MDVIIRSGRIIDPASDKDTVSDLLVSDGRIKEIGKSLKAPQNAEVIDAKGLVVMPGLVDMHCHLRDPGDPEEETIASGTRAAAAGGFTSVACMANTKPPLDNPATVKYVVSKAKNEGVVNVFPIGAVTIAVDGKQLTEMGRMIDEGAVAFSDDGRPVSSSQIMRYALQYAKAFGVKIISHAEVLEMSSGGQMNESALSTILGLKGTPAVAEEIMVERDISLAKEFGPVHITHVSTAGSVRLIRAAKENKIPVTCDTCPHYFALTENAVDQYNTLAKVNPPLRGEEDVREIIKGLKDGIIDAIATDHAPHREEKKNVEFAAAASGMIGLETALSISISELSKDLSLKKIIEKLTVNPARILGINKGGLKVGSDADIAIIDPSAEHIVNSKTFASKSKNSPFIGRKVKGKVLYTIVSGKSVLKNGSLIS